MPRFSLSQLNKMSSPPDPKGVIKRPRLFHQLERGLQRKLILVSASAGFGKTCLLGSWARSSGSRIYWFSLDEKDNDPARFLTYFAHAIGSLSEDFKESFVSAVLHLPAQPQPPNYQALLASLLEEILQSKEECVLVLDDYHLVDSQAVHEVVHYLLDNLPPNFHLVIATRCDPPLPLARLKLDGQLLELRERDLCFSNEECAYFFNEKIFLRLSKEEIAKLTFFTEGWIAGLKLLSLSIEEHENSLLFISQFKGGNRYLFDYFSEEILNRQSGEIQAFLLRTSILDRFNASLCNAVVGGNDAQAMLERLEKANLFLVPLDEELSWFRFHHLFSEFLRKALQKTSAAEIAELHKRASCWHEEDGNVEAAIEHAVAAGALDQASLLIQDSAKAMLMSGELATLKIWLRSLPDNWIRSHPPLCLLKAWCLVFSFELDSFESYLKAAEKEGKSLPEAEAIRIYAASMLSNKSLGLSPGILDGLSDPLSFNLVSLILGWEYASEGRLNESSELLEKTARASLASGDLFTSVLAGATLASNEGFLGNLRKGVVFAKQAIQTASMDRSRPLPAVSTVYTALGFIYFEMNELDRAIHFLKEGIKLDKQWNNLDNLLLGHLCLKQSLWAKGEEVQEVEGEIERLLLKPELSHFSGTVAVFRAKEWISRGDLASAERWRRETEFSFEGAIKTRHELELCCLARLLLIRGKKEESLKISRRLVECGEQTGRKRMALEGQILMALARNGGSEDFSLIEQALSIAEQEGFVRIFLDKGEPMADLLLDFLKNGHWNHKGYARKLLSFMGKSIRRDSSLLSEREIEVLRLIASGKTNGAIATELRIAESTVKKHINNVFGKLDVKRRIEALLVAREKGLLG